MTTEIKHRTPKEYAEMVEVMAETCGICSEALLMVYATDRTQQGLNVNQSKYQELLARYQEGATPKPEPKRQSIQDFFLR